MSSDVPVPKRWFQFLLRTLLLLFIPVVFLAGMARWLLYPPPIDVAMTVKRLYWHRNTPSDPACLAAEVRITNRSRDTVWYMGNPRYCLLELVDGKWQEISMSWRPPQRAGEPERDWWLPQDSKETITIPVGVSEKATAMRVVVAFTTDRFMPKRHWVFSPEIRIVKKGKNYFPEMEERARCTESLYAPTLVSRDLENNDGKCVITSYVPVPTDQISQRPSPPANGGPGKQK